MAETKIIAAIVIGIIVLALALYFLLNVMKILPFPFGIWDADTVTAITSTVALRCAIDFVASGDVNVATCHNYRERLDLGLGQKLPISCDGPENIYNGVKYTCKTPVASNVILCNFGDSSMPPSCVVKAFTLPHEYSRGGLAIGPISFTIPVISNIADFFNSWIGTVGEPKFLVYFQDFDKTVTALWTPGEQPNIALSLAIGGVANSVFGVAKIVKAGITKGGWLLISKLPGEIGEKAAAKASQISLTNTAKRLVGFGALGAGKKAAKITAEEAAKVIERLAAGQAAADLVSREIGEIVTKGPALTNLIRNNPALLNLGNEITNYLMNKLGGTSPDIIKKAVDIVLDNLAEKLKAGITFYVGSNGKVQYLRVAFKDMISDPESLQLLFKKSVSEMTDGTAIAALLGSSIDEVGERPGYKFLSVIKDMSNDEFDNVFKPVMEKLANDLGSSLDNEISNIISSKAVRTALRTYIVNELPGKLDKLIDNAIAENGVITNLMEFKKYGYIGSVGKAVEKINSIVDETTQYAYYNFINQIGPLIKGAEDAVDEELIKSFKNVLARVTDKIKSSDSPAALFLSGKADVIASRLKAGTLSFIRGYSGLPTALSDYKSAFAISALLTAGSYIYHLYDASSEKYLSCNPTSGPNVGKSALCLHTNTFIAAYPNNTLSFPLASTDVVVQSRGPKNWINDIPIVGLFWGQDMIKGTIISPCKADIKVYPSGKTGLSNCYLADTTIIAYYVNKLGCVCYKDSLYSLDGTTPTKERIELDTNRYLSKTYGDGTKGRCPTSYDELDSGDQSRCNKDYPIGLGIVTFNLYGKTYGQWDDNPYNARDTNPYKDYVTLATCKNVYGITDDDYEKCVREDFYTKYCKNVYGITDIQKCANEHPEDPIIKESQFFSIIPQNIKPTKDNKYALTTTCLTTDGSDGWSTLPRLPNSKNIIIDADTESMRDIYRYQFPYDYCMYNKDNPSQIANAWWQGITTTTSLILDVVTAGAAVPLQFAIGGAGAWGEIQFSRGSVWPCYQGAGSPDIIGQLGTMWAGLWGSDLCKAG
jgi:hypothetical protein